MILRPSNAFGRPLIGMGQDVNSPPAHSAFSTPIGLLEFVRQLRELSDGKPVGFKLAIIDNDRELFKQHRVSENASGKTDDPIVSKMLGVR